MTGTTLYLVRMAPRVIQAGSPVAAPRPAWRQAIVSELDRPGKTAAPSNTITSPEAAPARLPHPIEAANRSALAHDLARFLHSNGAGISHTDALRMGPEQWRLARQAVRTGRPAVPSQATIQLTLERLKQLEAPAVTRHNTVPALIGFASAIADRPRIASIGNGLLYCRVGKSARRASA